MRMYGVVGALGLLLLFVSSLYVLPAVFNDDSQGLPDPRIHRIPGDELHDNDRSAEQLSEWTGFTVHLPPADAIPAALEPARGRAVAAFDPHEQSYLDDERWSEVRWDRRDDGSADDHPWDWVLLTQGRDLPVPPAATEVDLPALGTTGQVTSEEAEGQERRTVWLTHDGMDFALSIQGLGAIDTADFEEILAQTLE